MTQRRRLAERVERMPLHDPRRAVAYAALRGEQVTVTWRPRSGTAAAALAEIRQHLPAGRRKPELRALLNDDGTGTSTS